MAPRILIVAALAAAVALAPASASAQVQPAGTGEPAFTRSAQNTQWVEWGATSGADGYRLRADYHVNNSLFNSYTVNDASPAGGNSWLNWSGVASLQEGNQYGICVQGSYSLPNDSLFFPDGPNSCSTGTQIGRRSHTTIDRSKPTITVQVAGGAAFTRNTLSSVTVGYQDAYSPPFPANFLCVSSGATAEAACSGKIYGYTAACSNPAAAGKDTSFNCQVETSSIDPPDGPLFVCVTSADSSIPDNPSSSNQSATADKANLSDKTCDSVVMDRTAPNATITTASTTVTRGQGVAFTAQASDATSGLSPQAGQWIWNDGTPAGSGDSAVHTFNQAGSYNVQYKVADTAGNQTTATRSITVVEPPAGETPGGGSSSGGTGNGSGSTGSGAGSGQGGAAAFTAAQIIEAAGGGTAQSADLGNVTVLAPRRVSLAGRRRSFLLGVTANRAGLLRLKLVKGRRVRSRTSAVLAAGSKTQRMRLPKGMKPGRHALKVSFTPAGSSRAVTTSLGIGFTKPGRKARAAHAARTLPGAPRASISAAGLPAPSLPDGRLHGGGADRVFEVR